MITHVEHPTHEHRALRHLFSLPWILALALAVLALDSCFATQPPLAGGQRAFGVPGFWKGLWHGIIAPIAFLVSLFSNQVRVYASPNAGRWYDFGFMIGIGGFTHGVWRGTSRRPSQRPQRGSDDA